MLEYAYKSCVGNRKVNEDSVLAIKKENEYCFAVCDGLGGHGLGDVASKCVTDTLSHVFLKESILPGYLSKAFAAAQRNLTDLQTKNAAADKMKTTAAVMATDSAVAYVGHIGDSRVYIFSENNVVFRTTDHSVSQALALSGEITDNEIRTHSDRNLLLRAMGSVGAGSKVELSGPFNISECYAFLVCSDGFWEHIIESEMLMLLQISDSAECWLNYMLNSIVRNAGESSMDNYSAITVFNK